MKLDEAHCPCIPDDVHARWAEMSIEERLPFVNHHMEHVMREVLTPSHLYKKLMEIGKDADEK